MKLTTRSSNTFMFQGLLLLLVVLAADAAIVDLSQSWVDGSLRNQNKAYCTIQASVDPCSTRGYVVIQNGEILAEHYTTGNTQSGQYDAWSVTKSWATFLIGVLVDQGGLTITETLGDIFNTDADWQGVGSAADKKTVRVEEILSMSSGLVSAPCQPGVNEGQETLQAVLNHVNYNANQRGQFNYLAETHILSRIIERRAGASPRQFAESLNIFARLGMTGEFDWTTFGGIEGTAYGLKTNPRILAKLGQLYLQNGMASSSDQLISSSWVTASIQSYVTTGAGIGYGYQWYQNDNGGGAAAVGARGQWILFLPSSNTTISVMSDGCTGGMTSNTLVQTILNNLGDLTVQQTSCDQSFSYWNYITQHSGEWLWEGLRAIPNTLFQQQSGELIMESLLRTKPNKLRGR